MNEMTISKEYKELMGEFKGMFGEVMFKSDVLGSMDSKDAESCMKVLILANKLIDLSAAMIEQNERVMNKIEKYLDRMP